MPCILEVMKTRVKTLRDVLKNGGIGILPTDTLYGLVGSAFSAKAVLKIYKLRGRNAKKPMIVLIDSLRGLEQFGVKTNPRVTKFLKKLWPGPVSVILPCEQKRFLYLHRGTKTLAFRVPQNQWLRKLLGYTGPLVAPSANPEGKPPAYTISEAQKYFGNKVGFYVDAGPKRSTPSTLIEIKR